MPISHVKGSTLHDVTILLLKLLLLRSFTKKYNHKLFCVRPGWFSVHARAIWLVVLSWNHCGLNITWLIIDGGHEIRDLSPGAMSLSGCSTVLSWKHTHKKFFEMLRCLCTDLQRNKKEGIFHACWCCTLLSFPSPHVLHTYWQSQPGHNKFHSSGMDSNSDSKRVKIRAETVQCELSIISPTLPKVVFGDEGQREVLILEAVFLTCI